MARWMSTVRSARIGFLLAVQDLAQLGAIYGKEGRQIIVTDCSTKIALARTSADDAEWFSRGTGTATVLSYSAGDSRKRGDRLARSGNRGVNEIARPLLTPGEVTRLPEDTMLVLSGNRQPMLITQRRWYQDRRLHRLGRVRAARNTAVPPGARAAQGAGVEQAVPRQEADVGAATVVPAVVATTDAVQDDGAVRLDREYPAGEATWVPAPEDCLDAEPAAMPQAQPALVAAGTSAAVFELPEDG
jgi:type IV secretory pathway TraG/TraD family ATPase VirD4